MCWLYYRRPPSVPQDYGFAPGFIEQHLWWLKRRIFEWQSLSHLSHLKIVLGSVTVPMAFLIFLFSTCRIFRVCSACLIPSFTRCRHVEQSFTIISQLSMLMAAETSYPSCKHLWSEGVGSQFYMYPQAQSSRGLESFIFPSCICVPAI